MAVLHFIAFLMLATMCRSVSSASIKQKEDLVEKVNSLNLDDVVEDMQNFLKHMKNGTIAEERSFHYNRLDPSNNMPGANYMGTGLSTMVNLLQLGKVAYEFEHSVFGAASCTFCKASLMFIKYYLDRDRELEEVIADAKMLCRGVMVVSYRVCKGLVSLFTKEVMTVVKTSNQTPEQMCGFMFGEACNNPENLDHEWRPWVPPRGSVVEAKQVIKYNGKSISILHISDTHFDHLYKEGSNAECGEPMCCREDSGELRREEDRAGYWGDFRKCDTPLRTIEEMYRHIAVSHPNIDFIYWTGDLPAHDIWNQTKEGNKEIVRATARQLKKFFPDVPVYPALGNHESVPVDSFPPPSVSAEEASMSWLYSTLSEEWGHWLGENHKWSITHGAYYSMNVAPGLRVISLNMNYCMNKNLWLILNSTDPANELQWLVFELQLAEFKGEKVHILGHIPPGHVDCVKVWSQNFYEIISRYSSTVTAQFYGHTHTDEFQLFYSQPHHTPSSVAYIAPSVTPYYGLNPSYRLYTVSPQGEILDHHTWIMDLEAANANPSKAPPWYLLYSAKSAYKMRDLSPLSWQVVVERLQTDGEVFNMFYKHYYSGSKTRPPCDPACRHGLICSLVSGKSHSKEEMCERISVRGGRMEVVTGWWNWWNLSSWWIW